MPYCTIEEAWKTSLNPELETIQVTNGLDTRYNPSEEVDLKNSELYDSEGNQVTCKKEKQQRPKMKNFSRTYNRLSEHSGPKTRFTNDNQMVYVRSEDDFKLDNRENHPSYMNLDAPISEHNISMYEKLNDEYNKKFNKETSNNEEMSMMEDFTSENNYSSDKTPYKRKEMRLASKNYEYIINELKEENTKLKTMISELKNTKVEDKDSIFDLVLFLGTGVIIILMMENITKILRKF